MEGAFLKVSLGFALVGALLVSWVAGAAMGRRMRKNIGGHPQLAVVQSAILALLGLLLGFCFAGAVSRFVDRQDNLLREANAISTAYLRADLVDEPLRTEFKAALREYAQARLELFSSVGPAAERLVRPGLDALSARVWSLAVAAGRAQPGIVTLVVPPVNESLDLLSARDTATARHIPPVVGLVLIACAMASVGSIGFGVESSDSSLRIPSGVLIFLIAATLWITIDLDYPRVGLIRISGDPLREAVHSMQPAAP